MATLVTTEAEMLRIRRSISFCYLCGSSLSKGANSRGGLNAEHIVPQALFDTAPSVNAWRPILPVHKKCHDEIKNAQGEETAILLHKLHCLNGKLAAQNWAGNLKRLGLVLREEYDFNSGQPLYLVKGFGEAHSAVRNWVRGFHAVLYREFLPAQMTQQTFAPMGEMFIPEPGDTREPVGPEIFDRSKDSIIELLTEALRQRKFDEVRCWDDRCRYLCVWAEMKGRLPSCYWALLYDGVTDYAKGAPFSGSPWMGVYRCVRAPTDRTILASV